MEITEQHIDVTIYKQWKESGSKDCFNCWLNKEKK